MKYELRLAYDDLENIKMLFNEYTNSLGLDLSFQHYDYEYNHLIDKYGGNDGRLYILYVDNHPIGCGALYRLNENSCEFKRLYVRKEYRGHHFGELIMKQLIIDACDIGYEYGYLDTLSSLTSAVCLYEKLGFHQTSPYYENPIDNVVYYKIKLRKEG